MFMKNRGLFSRMASNTSLVDAVRAQEANAKLKDGGASGKV
jgi:hypothetical protein